MEKDFIPLPDAAKNAGVTVDKARHWVTQLGIPITKSGRVRQIPADGVMQLASMANLVTGGKSPQEAAAIIRATPCVAPVNPEPPSRALDLSPVISGQDEIQKAVLAIAESFKSEIAAMRFEMSRIADENCRLANEVSAIQKSLEYRKPEPIHHPAESVTRMNPQMGKPPARSAPRVQSQIPELSLWESVRLYCDDLSGFFLGKG